MKKKAFTLIELLVVTSIITLLMALLFPALSRARKQSQAVVCQGRLRQLGLRFAMWMDEGDMRTAWGGTDATWRYVVGPMVRGAPDVALCPSATRPLPGTRCREGDTFHAYSYLLGRPNLRGSYALNYGIFHNIVDSEPDNIFGPGHWINWHVKHASRVPVFFDCATSTACLSNYEEPPEYEGAWGPYMTWSVCINRHQSGINMTFMDGSVRKVGLKETWTLMWTFESTTTGPWTKAGGVRPEDWPKWMRQFRDY